MAKNSELTAEEILVLSKAEDSVRRCAERYTMNFVGFLSPAERSLIMLHVKPYLGVKTIFAGGYEDAERTVFICVPDYIDENDITMPFIPIEITGREIDALSHRDFLGSLLGLGIKREIVGDILPCGERCIVFVLESMYEYISANLERIGKYKVNVRACDASEDIIPERETEKIFGTAASLRLDAVLSLGLGVSRSNSAELIKAGRVFVNWKYTERTDLELRAGDVLSVRGFGRIRVAEIGGLSRKGRFKITLEKYL